MPSYSKRSQAESTPKGSRKPAKLPGPARKAVRSHEIAPKSTPIHNLEPLAPFSKSIAAAKQSLDPKHHYFSDARE